MPRAAKSTKVPTQLISDLADMAHKLRMHAVTSTSASKSGHPTSCSSMAEIISVLFFNTMKFSLQRPKDPSNDRFVLSKGHAAPILYAAWAEAGLFAVTELNNLRKFKNDLEGHPTPRLNFIDVATGSLGQGLSIACGMAYCGKNIDKAGYRVYCLLGDGECAEGSVWEALSFASFYKLDNLCVIIDCNRLGQSKATILGHDTTTYQKRVEAFGLRSLIIDGHNVEELMCAFNVAESTKEKPTCVIAKTYKGKYFPNIENKDQWHGKPLGNETEKVLQSLRVLIKNPNVKLRPNPVLSLDCSPIDFKEVRLFEKPLYNIGDMVATRQAYGTAIQKLSMTNKRIIALDADVSNSTFSEKVFEICPAQYVECYIAEQNLVGVAIGLACRNRCICFCSTFAAFFARAYDQIRMGAISQTNINLVGSHAGVSIGEDGPSQMGLEDLAMFRAIPGSTVFYPSDAVSCEKAVEIAANTPGLCYIRVSRPPTEVIYGNDEWFDIGKAKILRQSECDRALIITAGVTLYEALKAYDELVQKKIHVRIMDVFTLKPIDARGILTNAMDSGGNILTVEDHYPEGGIGEAVLSSICGCKEITVRKLAIPKVPRSGKCDELLEYYGINCKNIVRAIKCLICPKC